MPARSTPCGRGVRRGGPRNPPRKAPHNCRAVVSVQRLEGVHGRAPGRGDDRATIPRARSCSSTGSSSERRRGACPASVLVCASATRRSAAACSSTARPPSVSPETLDQLLRRIGRDHAKMTHRSHDRRRTPGHRRSHRNLRGCRQVLRGGYRRLPEVKRQAQRRGRSGANKCITQGWWRTADVSTPAQAKESFDSFCATVADARADKSVAELAANEPAPAASDALSGGDRGRRQGHFLGLVPFDGNFYSVPPELVSGPSWWSGPASEQHRQR